MNEETRIPDRNPWPSGRVARLTRHLGIGGPRKTPRRAPNREGQSAAMKWVRINEIWSHPATNAAAGFGGPREVQAGAGALR